MFVNNVTSVHLYFIIFQGVSKFSEIIMQVFIYFLMREFGNIFEINRSFSYKQFHAEGEIRSVQYCKIQKSKFISLLKVIGKIVQSVN